MTSAGGDDHEPSGGHTRSHLLHAGVGHAHTKLPRGTARLNAERRTTETHSPARESQTPGKVSAALVGRASRRRCCWGLCLLLASAAAAAAALGGCCCYCCGCGCEGCSCCCGCEGCARWCVARACGQWCFWRPPARASRRREREPTVPPRLPGARGGARGARLRAPRQRGARGCGWEARGSQAWAGGRRRAKVEARVVVRRAAADGKRQVAFVCASPSSKRAACHRARLTQARDRDSAARDSVT